MTSNRKDAEFCTPSSSCDSSTRIERSRDALTSRDVVTSRVMSRDRHYSAKRVREDSEVSSNSVGRGEAVEQIENVKRITMLEMEITKLKADNEKLRIESEFKDRERKSSGLREGADDRTARDRLISQRDALYEKNEVLTEELENVSQTYMTFHKEMTEKNNKLIAELGDIKSKLLKTTDEMYSEKRKAAHDLWLTEKRLREELSEREHRLITLENENKLKDLTITRYTEDLESTQNRMKEFSALQKSEFQLRMELDTMKNKELYATVFPEKIVKSAQVHEENVKLQRDIKNLKHDKESTQLLKMQLDDARTEIANLKNQLSEYMSCKDQYDTIAGELKDWRKVQNELKMSSPLSIISTVSQLQKDALQMTSTIEKYKAENASLSAELSELTSAHEAMSQATAEDRDKCEALRKNLSAIDVKCTEYRDEASSYKKLLETYQSTTEDERQSLPKKPGPKILHMKQNPYQIKLDLELKRLNEENAKLRKQLEQAENVSVMQDLENCQQKLSESEASLKKTKTIYQAKVKEFKEGIFDLFGYTVSCPADNQYALLSVFAGSQDDKILFYRVKNIMQLIENKYTKTLDMQAHISKLTQHRSIPLFLADHSSDLFHRQTFVDLPEQTCEFGGFSKK